MNSLSWYLMVQPRSRILDGRADKWMDRRMDAQILLVIYRAFSPLELLIPPNEAFEPGLQGCQPGLYGCQAAKAAYQASKAACQAS